MNQETKSSLQAMVAVVLIMGIISLGLFLYSSPKPVNKIKVDNEKRYKYYQHKAKLYWLLNKDKPIYGDSVLKYEELSRDYKPTEY